MPATKSRPFWRFIQYQISPINQFNCVFLKFISCSDDVFSPRIQCIGYSLDSGVKLHWNFGVVIPLIKRNLDRLWLLFYTKKNITSYSTVINIIVYISIDWNYVLWIYYFPNTIASFKMVGFKSSKWFHIFLIINSIVLRFNFPTWSFKNVFEIFRFHLKWNWIEISTKWFSLEPGPKLK